MRHDWTLACLLNETPEDLVDAEAVRAPDASCTFRQLAASARAGAIRLRELGARVGARVMHVSAKTSCDVVVLLGTAMSGATWVPVDGAAPTERMRFIIDEVEPCVVVAPRALHRSLQQMLNASAELIELELFSPIHQSGVMAPVSLREPLPWAPAGAEDIAYIIYTSGSTGRPKGVQISHRSVGTFLVSEHTCMDVRPGDRFMNTSPFYFDVCIADVVYPLSRGAAVHLTPPILLARAILNDIEKHRISHVTIPMAKLQLLSADEAMLRSRDLSSLRYINTGAERVDPRVFRLWLSMVPGLTVVNGYGPTEATSECIVNPVRDAHASDEEIACIGHPLPGTKALLIDADGAVLMQSEAEGELLVGGPQLMSGYFRRPAETGQAFVTIQGEPYYRTGDICSRDLRGRYTFLGRRDEEVKISGYRVHLNEIKMALLQCDEVVEAVVRAVDEGPARRVAAALVVATERDGELPSRLLHAVAARLPAHMVPKLWVFCDSLPRLPSGKTDVKRVSDALGAAGGTHPRARFLRADAELRSSPYADGPQ